MPTNELEFAALSFEKMLGWLCGAIQTFPDKRTGKNKKYTMEDCALGAFSVFMTQSPSFLAHQKAMQEAKGKSNAQTIFQLVDIPTDNHIRDMLDPVTPEHLFPVFSSAFDTVEASGHLDTFRSINDTLLIALDGTNYHSSKSIHCKNCSMKAHKNGTTTYSHTVITPVIVAPGKSIVFPLEPEFVVPQDGHKKQDCENAAAKRWVIEHAKRYNNFGVTILGDDLYCHQPFCQLLIDNGYNFIFTCKPDSHKTLYEWVADLDTMNNVQTVTVKGGRGKQRRIYTYRFINDVPIRDGDNALQVNWCEVTIAKHDGTVTYTNAFATNHTITQDNVAEVVAAGRARWKIENENNNTLKTKGYNFTHNYGHGKQHLSSLLATMIILAFLFHTLLEIGDKQYRTLRLRLPTRKSFFDGVRTLTIFICFDGWDSLMRFMLDGLDRKIHVSDINTLYDTT